MLNRLIRAGHWVEGAVEQTVESYFYTGVPLE